MGLSGIERYLAVQNSYTSPKGEAGMTTNDTQAISAGKDTITISGSADYLKNLQERFPQMCFSIGTGFVGETKQNTGDNANRWVFTISPKLLEKMNGDPEAEAEFMQKLSDIERATAFADSISKAMGMKTVYCENYIDENGKLHHASISVRKDELNEKLRAETQENMKKLIERVREKNGEAADKLEALLNKAEEAGELSLDDEDMRWIGSAAKTVAISQAQDDNDAEKEAAGDQTGSSGRVGINAAKLARMLAAAKTRSQVQAVMAKIQSDLKECEAGKAQGMDVDEASVKATKQLLQQAKSRLGSADNRKATPEEEMASSLASLM